MSRDETTLLVCAATRAELGAFGAQGEVPALDEATGWSRSDDVVYAVTGVGIPETLFRLLPLAQRLRPRCILNIGIAGAYPGSGLTIGDVVRVEAELFGDIGFELPEDPGFRPVGSTDLGSIFYGEPMRLSLRPEAEPGLSGITPQIGVGCTVNCCAGADVTGIRRNQQFGARIETMEGAAVALVGRMLDITVHEVRAISNIAARRDMRPENITLAIRRLHAYLAACRVV